MAKIKEDADAEIRENAEAASTIKKLQYELEVLRRQSDENNVASFMEVDTLRRELKKKEAPNGMVGVVSKVETLLPDGRTSGGEIVRDLRES